MLAALLADPTRRTPELTAVAIARGPVHPGAVTFENGKAPRAAKRLAQLRVRVGVRHDFVIGPGLTDVEIATVEQRFGFDFADDHRAFLGAGLPTGPGWPDWRGGDPVDLRRWLDGPVEGVLFDVRANGFWHPDWGARPADRQDAVTAARDHMSTVPQMVPVYGHRYLPAGRGTSSKPVLSMHQTDIIYYGLDLADYVEHEFGNRAPDFTRRDPKPIPFWDYFL